MASGSHEMDKGVLDDVTNHLATFGWNFSVGCRTSESLSKQTTCMVKSWGAFCVQLLTVCHSIKLNLCSADSKFNTLRLTHGTLRNSLGVEKAETLSFAFVCFIKIVIF